MDSRAEIRTEVVPAAMRAAGGGTGRSVAALIALETNRHFESGLLLAYTIRTRPRAPSLWYRLR